VACGRRVRAGDRACQLAVRDRPARTPAHAGAPFVFTHHTRFAEYGHYLGPLSGVAGAFTTAYLRRFWVGCDAIVAPSMGLADEIRGRLPSGRRDRVHVIPTGVDVAGIRASAPIDSRPEAGWPDDAVVVASLGRLAPEKRPQLLLDAVAQAAGVHPALRLLVIGGGPSLDELRSRADRTDLAGRVHFTGPLPRPEALARLAGADVFAFVSRTETQGLVLAEALAAGLPAVAVDGPGVRDSVRDGADAVVVGADPEPSVATRLAAAIAEIAGDAELRRTLARGARHDADRFSVEARVAEVEALYRSLLGGTR
jgi:glycosyltransferase involved in cell wall biosynthesis